MHRQRVAAVRERHTPQSANNEVLKMSGLFDGPGNHLIPDAQLHLAACRPSPATLSQLHLKGSSLAELKTPIHPILGAAPPTQRVLEGHWFIPQHRSVHRG